MGLMGARHKQAEYCSGVALGQIVTRMVRNTMKMYVCGATNYTTAPLCECHRLHAFALVGYRNIWTDNMVTGSESRVTTCSSAYPQRFNIAVATSTATPASAELLHA